jgi:hypothetical protein
MDRPNAILLETDGTIVLIADKEDINFSSNPSWPERPGMMPTTEYRQFA